MKIMRNPEKIGGILSSLLKKLGLWDDVRGEKIFIDWKEIVGEVVARYAMPVRFEDGELWLKVIDPNWRTEIFNIKQVLKEKINGRIGAGTVRRIRIL